LKTENQHIEFKSSFNDAVIETLCAFVNAKGGKVYVGLDDKGNPVSNFFIGKETIANWINEIKNKTQPSIIADIESVIIQGKEVICIGVNEFPVKPVSYKGRYYKRVNNSNHQLSAIEITNLSLQSLQLSWDSYPAQEKSLEDLDPNKVNLFIEKVNATGRFKLDGSWIENLQKLKLVGSDRITNAAWLLFAKEATGYNVHLGRLKTPSMIIDDKMLNGTLFDVVEETMRYLIGQIKVAFEITGMPTQRSEIFEYPLPALREIVLNAIIHRDYMSPIDFK
jgi:ATP-dependent DNA helicase RecG